MPTAEGSLLDVLYHPSITCIYNVDSCVKSKVLSSCHCFYAATMEQVHDGDSVNWNWVASVSELK